MGGAVALATRVSAYSRARGGYNDMEVRMVIEKGVAAVPTGAASAVQGGDALGGSTGASWRELSERFATQFKQQLAPTGRGGEGGVSSQRLQNLSELLRLQVDLSRYQLRVEMLAKVAESAVASLRKLQQPQ